MANTDLSRLLKSEEIRNVLRKPRKVIYRSVRRLNPLANTRQLIKLNPYAEVIKRRSYLANQKRKVEREIESAKRRKITLNKANPIVKAAKTEEVRQKHLAKAKAAKKTKPAKKVAAKVATKVAAKK